MVYERDHYERVVYERVYEIAICFDNLPIKNEGGQRKEHTKSRISLVSNLTRFRGNERILLKISCCCRGVERKGGRKLANFITSVTHSRKPIDDNLKKRGTKGKTLQSPLDCKEIKPVNTKGNQP